MVKMLKTLLLAAALLGLAVTALPLEVDAPQTFHGDKVFRIEASSASVKEDLEFMSLQTGIKLDYWKEPRFFGDYFDVRVEGNYADTVADALKSMNMKYWTVIDNVQAAIESQRDVESETFTSKYHTFEEITEWLAQQPKAYSSLASTVTVGSSYENRTISLLRIATGSTTKPAIWLDGGIHAREWISPATIVYIADALLSKYGKDARITKLVDSFEWLLLPVFNPDGYAYTWSKDRMWRKTRSKHGGLCVGTDPNRNWNYHWCEAGSSTNPCSDSYCGPSAFSEVELKSVAGYIQSRTNIKGYINFHAYSQLWMAPWGWTSEAPKDSKQQLELANKAAAALKGVHGTSYTVGPISTTIYPASGSSADWTYGECGIKYSYGVELRDTGRYGFLLPESQIIPTGEETLEGVLTMAEYILANP
eukprot:Colp12_sorted_trinity150504_noHs@19441